VTLDLLSIREFKCFRKADVALAPMTILTGFNAAGKSTTLQSLLLLAQGLRTAPKSRYLPLNGPMVRLGTAGDVVRRNGDEPVRFGVNGFGSSLTWQLGIATREESADDEWETDDSGRRERLEVLQVFLDGEPVYTDRRPQIRPPLSELRKAIHNIIYLSASRHGQQDIFPSPDDSEPVHADVGNEGQFAPWWYVRTADNKVHPNRRHPEDPSITVRSQVDAWLNHLFPGTAANAKAIADTSYARLEFKIGRTGNWSRPANIGYGLSYAFPLIVALLNARPGQIVIVDSPEAHLHPRAQSRMGGMLATFAAAGVQLLIESHSDHVLSGCGWRFVVKCWVIRNWLCTSFRATLRGAETGSSRQPCTRMVG